jgi:lipopolysaccharide transport system permease protein
MKPTAPQTIPVSTAISAENSPAPGTMLQLPDQPLVVIQPSKKWNLLNLGEIWAYRELLFFLTWRDVKVRYKQTMLGAAWAILQPLFMMIIFTIFFGKLAGVESAGAPYPVFALAGLVPWTFFFKHDHRQWKQPRRQFTSDHKVYFPSV